MCISTHIETDVVVKPHRYVVYSHEHIVRYVRHGRYRWYVRYSVYVRYDSIVGYVRYDMIVYVNYVRCELGWVC